MDIKTGIFSFLFPLYNEEYLYNRFQTNDIEIILEKLQLNIMIISNNNKILAIKKPIALESSEINYDNEKKKMIKKLDSANRKHESKSRLRKFLKTGIRGDVNHNTNIQRNEKFKEFILNDRNNYLNKPWNKLSAFHKKKILTEYINQNDIKGDENYIQLVKNVLKSNSISQINKLDTPIYDKKEGKIIELSIKKVEIKRKPTKIKKKKKKLFEECANQRLKNQEIINRTVKFTADYVIVNR